MRNIKLPKLYDVRAATDDFGRVVYYDRESSRARECKAPAWLQALLRRTEAAGHARGVGEVRAATRKALGL